MHIAEMPGELEDIYEIDTSGTETERVEYYSQLANIADYKPESADEANAVLADLVGKHYAQIMSGSYTTNLILFLHQLNGLPSSKIIQPLIQTILTAIVNNVYEYNIFTELGKLLDVTAIDIDKSIIPILTGIFSSRRLSNYSALIYFINNFKSALSVEQIDRLVLGCFLEPTAPQVEALISIGHMLSKSTIEKLVSAAMEYEPTSNLAHLALKSDMVDSNIIINKFISYGDVYGLYSILNKIRAHEDAEGPGVDRLINAFIQLLKNNNIDGLPIGTIGDFLKDVGNKELTGMVIDKVIAEGSDFSFRDAAVSFLNLRDRISSHSIKKFIIAYIDKIEFGEGIYSQQTSFDERYHSIIRFAGNYHELLDDYTVNKVKELIYSEGDAGQIKALVENGLVEPSDALELVVLRSKNISEIADFIGKNYKKLNHKQTRFVLRNTIRKNEEIVSHIEPQDREGPGYSKLDDRVNRIYNNLFSNIDWLLKRDDYLFPIILLEMGISSIGRSLLIERIVNIYSKHKEKTFKDIYNETIKSKPYGLLDLLNYPRPHYPSELNFLITQHFVEDLADISRNTDHFFKLIRRLLRISSMLHMNTDLYDSRSMDVLRSMMLNTSIDLEQQYVSDFLDAYVFLANNEDALNNSIDNLLLKSPDLIDKDKFIKALERFDEIEAQFRQKGRKVDISRDTIDVLKYLNSEIRKIQKFDHIIEYINSAKPKDPNLYKLDMDIGEFKFSVLKYLDPFAFDVGLPEYTNCCQRLGGAAEEAAIDSFINPLAGVLILYHSGRLVSQSYFHYVPEDNGFILDNVESNDYAMRELNLSMDELSRIYANYAIMIKQKYPDIKYIKCGILYNEINNNLFKHVKEKSDPRHFEVDSPYTDYSHEQHISLLDPKGMESINVSVKASKSSLPMCKVGRDNLRLSMFKHLLES